MKEEARGSFTTPVTSELLVKTFWAWLTNRLLVHKDVLIEAMTSSPKDTV